MNRAGALALVIAAMVAAPPVDAQVRPPSRPPGAPGAPPPTQPAPRPGQAQQPGGLRTAAADTTKADSTAKFSPPDSVAASLMNRPGYTVTRYEGEVVTFDAVTRALAIAASTTQKALVEREGLKVATDTAIVYDDRAGRVNVEGNYVIIPGAGQSPIQGAGRVNYDVEERSGRLTNARVTVDESGQRWFIKSDIGKTVLGDSVRAIPPRFYGLVGELTSCEDSVKHYHFRMREIKRTEKTLVARPAVLYIADVPVAWLPFVFQDIRPGRRSGVLPPQIGASDIVRNNPSYRRHLQNIGYYWAASDYADLAMWFDWRSGAGGIDELDPGWLELNGQSKYRWSARFIEGDFAAAYMRQNDGSTMHRFTWGHRQRLGRERNFVSNLNYTSSTAIQRRNTINPYMAMATIASSFNLTDKLGPFSMSLGGDQKQYPGRTQIDRTMPNFSLTSTTMGVGDWLTWTPSVRYSESASLKIDQQTSTFRTRFTPGPDGRVIQTDSIRRDHYKRQVSIGSPIKLFGWDLPTNDISIQDDLYAFPENTIVYPDGDSTRKEERFFAQTYRTAVNWNPSISLPPMLQRFKVTPSITLQNVDGGQPFLLRTQTSNGEFVSQSKRLSYGLSTAPAIYGMFPGFGPFLRFRHAITPSISYGYAPSAKISKEFMQAAGINEQTYLGSLAQNAVSLTLTQNVEAKVRSPRRDTTGANDAQKLKVMSLRFSPLTYDFERARHTGRKLSGFTSEQLNTNFDSELIPGFTLNVIHSLFEGSTQTDTARFDPMLTSVSSSLRFTQRENPFTVLTRLFGRALPDQSPSPQAAQDATTPGEADMARRFASQPVAGQAARGTQFVMPLQQGWEVALNFGTQRPRPLRGDRVTQFNPEVNCAHLQAVDPFGYQRCLAQPSYAEPFPGTTGGAPAVQMPRTTNMGANTRFALTQKWAATWDTSYDFEQNKFASHIVSLQRDLHDWRAIFNFTHSPNGNFAFSFFIALKPQPELKFDYSRATYRSR